MGVDVTPTVRVFGDNFCVFSSIGSLLKLTALLDVPPGFFEVELTNKIVYI